MTQNIEDLHVYLRSIRPGERTSLSVLAGLVHRGAVVLDLGCGSGALGEYLAETQNCTTDGLTWSAAEAEHAQPHYRKVIVADLELSDLFAHFDRGGYDYIVCADVLEHLRQPERILQQCRELLKPGGKLLVSVPNAGYAGLVAELMQGEFRYREEGLLDRTHLRFFTRRSLARFLGENAWSIDVLDTVRREMPESEFRTQFDDLPPAVARFLLETPDALTYQFVGAAHPVAEPVEDNPANATDTDTEPARALFTAQLYVDRGQGYTEDGKLSTWGAMGQSPQSLEFSIPTSDQPITRMRLDPADRPGFLHLHELSLVDGNGQILWRWQHGINSVSLAETPHQHIAWQGPTPLSGNACILLLTGDDPWFELPIPQAVLEQTRERPLTLQVHLGWPMSADYLALANTVRPLQQRVTQLSDESFQLRSQVGDLTERTARLSYELEARRTAYLRESSQYQRNNIRLEHELQTAQSHFAELASHFQSIEKSLVYRATRPLAHTKRRLDKILGRPQSTRLSHDLPSTAQPMRPSDHPVDVIVPVYRGLADTQLCVESVLAAPVQSAYRLIIINDCSPEPEVTAWLRERAAQEPRITLLENEENLGFVGTVNRGMALSATNDVLLLNSDTEVANQWLDRIRAAAYGDQKIASVTPLSTNATICSYPRFCEDNPLPEGYDTARLDALCAQTNAGVVVDVPTGVGFCMYIRRDSLDAVGLFDTKNFGKGYGEENDFCQRAQKAGWRNLHLLDTFVLHTGGVSFGDSKSPRERAAMDKLARLHPNYSRDVHKFVQEDPAQPYRIALDIARIRNNEQPVVLAVLHDRAGGTVRHVRELAQHLCGQAQFLILCPAPNQSVVLRMAAQSEAFELTFRLEDQYQDLIDTLHALGVVHVHYHHLLGHGREIRNLPALLGVSYDFTTHDFYSYCAHITLTGTENRYVGEVKPGTCKCCDPDMPSPRGDSIAHWRHDNERLLNGARHVLAPSHDTARRIAGFAPSANVQVMQHTDIADDAALPPPHPEPIANRRLKIVVLGALSEIKGADVLEAAALHAAKSGAPLEFHLLGYGYRQLKTQPHAALSVHGAYKDEDLPGLLAWLQPDLVWFPAQWPETYSYTLSAALQAGLPVVVPDVGAFAERVQDRPWTWVSPWDRDGKSWVEFFSTLREQHFATGHAPTPVHMALPALEPLVTQREEWNYRDHYLQDVNSVPLAQRDATLLDLAFIQEHKAQPVPVSAAKSNVLGLLDFLRSLPVLSSVSRKIPQPLRHKVKTWLNG